MGLWASEWLSGTGGGVSYVQVETYADLPDPTTVAGKVYVVLTPSGVWPFNRKPAGMYYSDGAAWNYMSAYPGMLVDTNFGIQNAVDASKVMKFDASTITAPFTRTYLAPDKNGTLALLSDTGNLQSVSKSANYTASPFELVSCDISAGSFTVTFPSAPADKTVIYVKLNTIGTPGLNRQLTLATSGTDKFNTATGNTQIYMYLFGEFAQCQYDASTGLWYTFISAGTYNFATNNPGIDCTTLITNANISIDTTTRILTIVPPLGYFNIFVDGSGVITRYRKVGTINFPAFTDTSGTWYFYFDSTGTAITTQTPWSVADFASVAPVYRILWNLVL